VQAFETGVDDEDEQNVWSLPDLFRDNCDLSFIQVLYALASRCLELGR